MDNPIQTPKQSENISAKANKATNNTDKADKKLPQMLNHLL